MLDDIINRLGGLEAVGLLLCAQNNHPKILQEVATVLYKGVLILRGFLWNSRSYIRLGVWRVQEGVVELAWIKLRH